MKPQVDATFYNFSEYVTPEQFLSYYNQLKLIYEINPSSILEIGVGGRIVEKLLPNEINYTSFDLSRELKPNVVGTIERLPFGTNVFELVVCFEVLEHLQFEKFVHNLKEIARVSKKDVLISLPYSQHKFMISMSLPFIENVDIILLIPRFYRKHKFDGLHYWEIGKRNYPMKKVKGEIEKVFTIKKFFTSKENTYHTFFILEKKT
jgi:hypothetical protein